MFLLSTPTTSPLPTPSLECSKIDAVSSNLNSRQCGTNGASPTVKSKNKQTEWKKSLSQSIASPLILNGSTQGQFCLPMFNACNTSSVENDTIKHNINGKLLRSAEKRTSDNLVVDVRIIALVILVVGIVIAYKMILVTVPYANKQQLWEASTYAQNKYQEALNWANEKNLASSLMPLICGLAVALTSFMLVYLDSNVPGADPPTPFSPKTRQHIRQQRKSAMHLGYITALAAGFIVSAFMYVDF